MQASYSESDLVFQFPPHWGVRKYDEQPFYKKMSGFGLKGMDFLLVDPIGEGHLYLVEVKNYRIRTNDGGTFVPRLKSPAELAAILATKYEHTLHAIRAIQLYYQRKWWYRLFGNRLTRSRRFQSDAIFWHHVLRLAQNQTQHTVLLWFEQEEADEAYTKALRQVLKYELELGVQMELASTARPAPAGVIVRKAD